MNNISYNDNEKPPTERVYRLSEVSSHTTKETGIWVIYNNDVYDITKFVANHPGGQDKIMLAAGKSVEPFWRLYRQHYNSKLPMELLGNTIIIIIVMIVALTSLSS
jgi:sulfite oxidase